MSACLCSDQLMNTLKFIRSKRQPHTAHNVRRLCASERYHMFSVLAESNLGVVINSFTLCLLLCFFSSFLLLLFHVVFICTPFRAMLCGYSIRIVKLLALYSLLPKNVCACVFKHQILFLVDRISLQHSIVARMLCAPQTHTCV